MNKKDSVAIVILAIGGALSFGGNAQTQTADGAQKFLTLVGQQGGAIPGISGLVPVTVTRVFPGMGPDPVDVDERYIWSVARIDPGEDLCHTRAVSTLVDVSSKNIREQPASYDYVYTAKASPVYITVDIDWSTVAIQRGSWHAENSRGKPVKFYPDEPGITAQVGDKSLQWWSKDAELIDRIEFAMKFLKASCDRTAGTGF